MALDFFAGCIGGAAGLLCGHPLDTVKVRLQTQSPTNVKYRGTFHALSTIIKQESVPGLFKGVVSPLYGVAAINALVFGVYGTLRPYIAGPPGHDALWAHFIAGAASGSVQSIISSPIELIKIRMQLNDSSTSSNSSWNVLKNIYKNEGGIRRGLFKGWATTLCREIPGFGFYFATYELLTTRTGREIGTFDMLMAGGMSGVVSWMVTYPTDVIKTRIQMDTDGKYKGIIDCIKKVYHTEGIGAFSRGLSPALLRAFPTNAATFTVVTWIMRLGEEKTVNDLQTSSQTLADFLEEYDVSRRIYREQIYSTLQFKIPQPQFLTVQCFLNPSNKFLDMKQIELAFDHNSTSNENNLNNNLQCESMCLEVSKEYNFHLIENVNSNGSNSLMSVELENVQETGLLQPMSLSSRSSEEDKEEFESSNKNSIEVGLLDLTLTNMVICKCIDQCVC